LAERGRIVLREGGPDDVLRYVDGVLLVDIWDELVCHAMSASRGIR
jgi:hypothetical protein